MRFLNGLDYTVIGIYSAILVVMAVVLQRLASRSLESYFLAGRQLPWWALGVSGMTNFLDMTGTMVIVSFLYLLGPRGLYVEFRGGAVLVLAFMMCWTGKWHYRSQVMTPAEWNIYRYGAGAGAKAARVIGAIGGVALNVGMLAYLVKGAGMFLSMFMPYSPLTCAFIMIALTTLYTLMSGFYGVVYTDLFQSGIILATVVIITILAISKVFSYEGDLGALAAGVTGNTQWLSSVPHTYTHLPPGEEYAEWEPLLAITIAYFIRNVFGGLGTGADPRYFGARNERECGLLTFFWTWLMTFRWPLMMGFAALGLFLVHDMFPDQTAASQVPQAVRLSPEVQKVHGKEITPEKWEVVVADVAANPANYPKLGRKLTTLMGPQWPARLPGTQFYGGDLDRTAASIRNSPEVQARWGTKIDKSRWDDIVTALVQRPEQFPRLMAELQTSLGAEKWREKLMMVGYEGAVNPERILPGVILMRIPMGLRGLFIISLVAAAMSTFAPTVNSTTALFTRDIYQAFFNPKASNRQLMACNYFFGMALVGGGMLMAYTTKSINEIWDWIIMGLGSGLAIPGILRLYWWRFNAGGANVGIIVGLLAAVLQRIFLPNLGPQEKFFWISVVSLAGTVAGTYMFPPTDRATLEHFYKTTRPFGLWGPLKHVLTPEVLKATKREHFYDLVSLPFALGWQITLFLLPMQVIIAQWHDFKITLVIFSLSLLGVYLFWYRQLPPASVVAEIKATPNNGTAEAIAARR